MSDKWVSLHMYILGFRTRDEENGATATEYALLVAFIAFAIILGVTFFGTQLRATFSGLGTTVGSWTTN